MEARHLAHQEVAGAAITGIVGVDDQIAVQLDEQHGVLVVVGDACNPQAWRQLRPLAVLQHTNVEAKPAKVASNAPAVVVSEQDLLVAQRLHRRQAQVVRMTVADPQELAVRHVLPLLGRNFVRQHPRTEVGRPEQPRVRRQHRATIVEDEAGVTDRLEA